MMMMMIMMMTLITCQMTSSRGGIATPPFPTNKGAPKNYPYSCNILKVLLEIS